MNADSNNQIESTKFAARIESMNEYLKAMKEFEKKFNVGLERYNSFKSNGKHWFEDSIFEKDKNTKDGFIIFLSEISHDDYYVLSAKFWMSFHNSFVEDENGIVVAKGPSLKSAEKEFASLGTTINYFQDEIYKLEEGAKKFEDDSSEVIELLTDVLNFFKNYQSETE